MTGTRRSFSFDLQDLQLVYTVLQSKKPLKLNAAYIYKKK